MIEIAGKQLNTSVIEILNTLKLYLADLGQEYFSIIRDTNNDIMTQCPNHSNGHERKPSCGIRKSDGFVHCFSCGYSVPIQEMISNVLGYNDGGIKGTKWLLNNFIETIATKREEIDIPDRTIKPDNNIYISEEELDKYRYYHPYMWKRGLTPELVEKYDIGFDKDYEFKSAKAYKSIPCITFPIKDLSGNVITVVRRAIDSKLFIIPNGIEKPIYGLFEAVQSGKSEVIVCESVFNALTCIKYGKMAIALLGTGAENQYEQLKKMKFRKYILGLDGDSAGDSGRLKFYKNLKDVALISYLKTPRDGRDINDLTQEQFNKLEEIPMNF